MLEKEGEKCRHLWGGTKSGRGGIQTLGTVLSCSTQREEETQGHGQHLHGFCKSSVELVGGVRSLAG